jgi:hypothetical protein
VAIAISISVAIALLGEAKAEAESVAVATGGGTAVSVTLAIAIAGLKEAKALAERGSPQWEQQAKRILGESSSNLFTAQQQLQQEARAGRFPADRARNVASKVTGASQKIAQVLGSLPS